MLRRLVAILLLSMMFAEGQQPTPLRSHAPRLPNAVLLTGDVDGGFFLTQGNRDIPSVSYPLSRAPFITSSDGLVLVAHDANQQLAVYQQSESKWTTLKNHCGRLGAISPDDTTLACLDYQPSADKRTVTITLKFINLATAREEIGPQIASGPSEMAPVKAADLPSLGSATGSVEPSTLDWSPDGKHIAFGFLQVTRTPIKPLRTAADGSITDWKVSEFSEVRIIDLSTGSVRRLADGYAPSWSPSGEWIAYSDVKVKQLFLVRPDGTYQHPVARLRKDWSAVPAVWSPDSRQLILNQWWDYENGSFAIDLIDLDNLKSRRLIRNSYQVYRWLSRLP